LADIKIVEAGSGQKAKRTHLTPRVSNTRPA